MKILVTRPRARRTSSPDRLEALGHEAIVCPLIEIEPLGDEPIDVAAYDWVVVTSVNGARELRRRLRGAAGASRRDRARHRRARSAAPTSSRRVSTQEGLLAELPRPAGRVLFAGAEGARRLLADELGADVVTALPDARARPATLPDADLVVLASASAARAFAALGSAIPAVSIGPETTAAARAAGVRVVAEAATHDLERPRRRDRLGGALTSAGVKYRFITFLTDFGLQDDFVGTCHGVIKRIAPDAQIIDITHGIPRRRDPPGSARAREHGPVHAGRRPSRGRRSRRRRARGGRSRCATRRAASSSGPTTGCSFRAAERNGDRGRARARESRLRARRGLAHVPRPGSLLARRGALSRSGCALDELGPPVAVDALVRLDVPAPEIGADPDRGGRPLRRQLRQHRAQPDARARERRGDRPGHAGRARARRRARTSRSLPAPSRTPGRATSSSTRTATGTCRSRSAAAARPRCCRLEPGQSAADQRPPAVGAAAGWRGLSDSPRHKDVRGTVSPARTSFFSRAPHATVRVAAARLAPP